MISPEVQAKYDELREIVRDLDSVVVGFSGGVDSALVLKVAADELGDRCLAVIGDSEAFPAGEIEHARAQAAAIGARYRIIPTHELKNPHFRVNNPDRCYYCKTELFSKLREEADAEGARWILDGSHVDDAGDHRPGLRAAEERGVRSPLVEAGLGKAEVRELARHLGLEVWDKPSFACLSSRFPYGTAITPELLSKVDRAEAYMRGLGFRQVRVRHHGETLRIEVEPADLVRAAQLSAEIVPAMREIGYTYVTLDLEGYRSGKMNDVLKLLPRPPRRMEDRS